MTIRDGNGGRLPRRALDAIGPLPTPYHRHLERIVQLVDRDLRIRALWLSGSVARGTADPGSDLDLVLAVADDSFDEFVDNWQEWLGQVTPTLVAKTVPGSRLIFYALTTDLCRIDGVVEPASATAESRHCTRIPLLDRDDLDQLVPAPTPGPGPDPVRVTAMIEEFWRILANFPAMLNGRRDLLCAQVGIRTGTQMLYDLFVETNQPIPPMGVKQYSARLTADQVAVLQALPDAAPDRDQLITANRALCAAMAEHGRTAAERIGATYPEDIAAAVSRHLRSSL